MPLAIASTGLVTSVGLSAPATCAALRAKISNPTETRFIDSGGEWIMAHQVELEQPWRGLTKLAKMAALAIDEALAGVAAERRGALPLLLCVAERERPGRLDGLDQRLLPMIESELGLRFAPTSLIVPHGRVAAAVALSIARKMLGADPGVEQVLIAATDSLLTWPTLGHYEREGRLLTPRNSNGFMPGEGAGAMLVRRADASAESSAIECRGIGFGVEAAHIASDEPLRAEGLRQAVVAALADAGCAMHDTDFRITDLSGEHYYFKEAALALSRTLRRRKDEHDLWHPAECTGEAGALAGLAITAVADAACRKGYTKGPTILAHLANDAGQRAGFTLHQRAAT
jgi:3-oxoacyl-[acyl-carrier-protein] synthase-1